MNTQVVVLWIFILLFIPLAYWFVRHNEYRNKKIRREFEKHRQLQKQIDHRNNSGNRIFNQCFNYIEGCPRFRIEQYADQNPKGGHYYINVGVAGESIAPWGFGAERGFPILQVSIHHSGEIHIHEGSYGDDFFFQNDEEGVLGAIGTVLPILSKSVEKWSKITKTA